MTMRERFLQGAVLLLFSLLAEGAVAQQFSVRTFRLLPNDITAYIDPVRDLNGEACALIKVVGDPDFVFSSPLGIVQRRDDVGEIWIYVPRGSVLLTVKHPQWGVLRDYRFPTPLESRMTYELVMATPIVSHQPVIPPLENRPVLPDTLLRFPAALPMHPSARPKRPRERLQGLLLAQIGLPTNQSHPSFGFRAALMRRHGAYLLLQGDLRSIPSTQGECNREGVPAGANGIPYYTGQTEEGRRMVLAGGVHRIVAELCLYEGIGYGRRTVGWETAEGEWLRNTGYSSQGISAEVGLLWRFRKWVLSAGALTIAASHWEANIGIGFHF